MKSRLMTAYTEFLEDLQQVELPVAGKQAFSELHSVLHRSAAVGNIDSVRASVQKMSSQEAARYARTIVRLYAELLAAEHGARAQAEHPLKVAEVAPPRYLASGGH